MERRSGIHVTGTVLGLALVFAHGTAVPAAAGVEGSTWGRVKALYGDSGTRFDAGVPESQAQVWSILRELRGPTLRRLLAVTPVQVAGTGDCFLVLGEGTEGTVTADVVTQEGGYVGGLEGMPVPMSGEWRFKPVDRGGVGPAFDKRFAEQLGRILYDSLCAGLGATVTALCIAETWVIAPYTIPVCVGLGRAIDELCRSLPNLHDEQN